MVVLKAVIGAGGTYTVSVHGGIDQLGAGEGEIAFTLPVNVSDGVLTTPSTLTVTIEDDSPVLGAFDPGTIPNQVGTVNGFFDLRAGADGIDHFNITGPTLMASATHRRSLPTVLRACSAKPPLVERTSSH